MSAAYTDWTSDSRVTYANFTGKMTCKIFKTFQRLSHLFVSLTKTPNKAYAVVKQNLLRDRVYWYERSYRPM